MRVSEVFHHEATAKQSEAISQSLYPALEGVPVAVGLASLFVVFVSVCKQHECDPGACFDDMLGVLDGRKRATHAAPKALQ